VLNDTSRFRPEGPDWAGVEGEYNNSAQQSRMWSLTEAQPACERHRFPVSFSFDGDLVTAVPFAWVDAFDGHYEYNFWSVVPSIRREGKPTHGLWTLLGFVLWDAPRIETLKTTPFLSHGQTGWARSGTST
jgi:hypothetical protein